MELELETAPPPNVEAVDRYLCLPWPFGGLWKIEKVDGATISCLSWRKVHMTPDQVHQHQLILTARTSRERVSNEPTHRGPYTELTKEEAHALSTLFKWRMVHGKWGTDAHHWFLHTLDPPSHTASDQNQFLVQLFTGFAAFEARIDVNAVTAIDTVAQTYAADVTWQVTMPGVTSTQNPDVLLQFLDVLDIDMDQVEFSNVTDMKQNSDLSRSITAAGDTRMGVSEDAVPVFHVMYSRRVRAVFTHEMALHTFPFDQQKLTFELTTGSSGLPDGPVHLIPTPADPGSLVVDNFHLGNVFNLAFYDKVFVGQVVESGTRKTVTFEVVLERKSTYYVTNVALVAAIITYLCFFVSWVPADKDGNVMETGTRLQNATAMVLTAVTFKNQVSSLVPQISYFTILDSYVTMCFMVTCFVTLESALYPLCETWFQVDLDETVLLFFALLMFSITNIAWASTSLTGSSIDDRRQRQ